MKRRYFYHYEFVGILLSLGASYIGSYFTQFGLDSGYYSGLVKSSLTPPDIVFPIVWTILYILMGIGIGRIWRLQDSFFYSPFETGLFVFQLVLNVFWTYLFFYLYQPTLAFFEIIPFLVLLMFIVGIFFKIDKCAGFCYIPYFIWIGFASYLNYFIVINNV